MEFQNFVLTPKRMRALQTKIHILLALTKIYFLKNHILNGHKINFQLAQVPQDCKQTAVDVYPTVMVSVAKMSATMLFYSLATSRGFYVVLYL